MITGETGNKNDNRGGTIFRNSGFYDSGGRK